MQLVSTSILEDYIFRRYRKQSFCDFPFDATLRKAGNRPSTVPPRASQMEVALLNWYTSPNQRSEWVAKIEITTGKALTKQVPNLNKVEIDNSIAVPAACQFTKPGHTLKVIGLNAGRGAYWFEIADIIRTTISLEKPDLIILNEMDIGMARSGNIHTTRKLAFELGMNYDWGLEFVELMNGNHEEQKATKNMKNALGLHGNAILSTCSLYDPLILRDALDEKYFTNRRFKMNAIGSEKRLGGRTGLFVRTGGASSMEGVNEHIIVGSVHKVHPSLHKERIWQYFNATPGSTLGAKVGIITAGDEKRDFCPHSGLQNLDDARSGNTWPADCKWGRLGKGRGDNFCGDMTVIGQDETILPCYYPPVNVDGTATQVSDHSFIKINLQVPE